MAQNRLTALPAEIGCLLSLKVLDLRANYIGDEGATALVEAARGSQTLKELNLHCNDFGPPLQAALEHSGCSQMSLFWLHRLVLNASFFAQNCYRMSKKQS
jgi:hypothetical protein